MLRIDNKFKTALNFILIIYCFNKDIFATTVTCNAVAKIIFIKMQTVKQEHVLQPFLILIYHVMATVQKII